MGTLSQYAGAASLVFARGHERPRYPLEGRCTIVYARAVSATNESSDHEFRTLVISNWQGLLEVTSELSPDWVFRGQRDSSWELKTSLERNSGPRPPPDAERQVLNAFQRRAPYYVGATAPLPKEDRVIEWLALVQHHGGPNRLLDWTRSPFVALFFAVEDATGPEKACAVWALDEQWLHFKAVDAIADENAGIDFS